MGSEGDPDYDAAVRGYGAAEADADEDTPDQEQQRPEHRHGENVEPGSDERTGRRSSGKSGRSRGADR